MKKVSKFDWIEHDGCKELAQWLGAKPSWGLRMRQDEYIPRRETYLIFNKRAPNGQLLPLEVCLKVEEGMVSISGPKGSGIAVSFSKSLAERPNSVKMLLKEFESMLPKQTFNGNNNGKLP